MKQIQKPKKANGEMLPLMDMIFLLLVVFIFMIIQMRPNFGVSVELPDIGETAPIGDEVGKEKVSVTIAVTKDNKYFVNEKESSADSLHSDIMAIAKNAESKNIAIILRGDKTADYGNIIKVFSVLRGKGINDILFDVDK